MRPSSRYTRAAPSREYEQSRCHAEVFAAADICSRCQDKTFVGLVTFLPGPRTVNVIDTDFISQLRDALEWLKKVEPPISFALFSSGVPSSFVAGADLKLQAQITDEADATAQSAGLLEYTCLFHAMPFVTVALIEGSALGGGLELALACHLIVARPVYNKFGTESQCLSLPEVKLGVLPGAGGCVRLPLRVGLLPALNLILQGSAVSISQAAKMGIVDSVWTNHSSDSPSIEFLPWVLEQLISKNISSRSSNGIRKNRFLNIALRFPLFNSLFRSYLRRIIDAKTRGHFPAPYAAVDAIMDCWGKRVGVKSKRWPYEFSVSALACAPESREFGRLAVSAESKALMSLFISSKLPAKVTPPNCVVSSTPCPNQITLILSADAESMRAFAVPFIFSLLTSGITCCLLTSHEEFELTQSAVKKEFARSFEKGSISDATLVKCNKMLQHTLQLSESSCNETVLHLPCYTRPDTRFTTCELICCSPIPHGERRFESNPLLCLINWSGCKSTIGEIIIGPLDGKSVPNARSCSQAAALSRSSGFSFIFTQNSMSASFEVFCAIFCRAVYVVAHMADCAESAVAGVQFVDQACTSSGWDCGPFEIADKLGAALMHALLVHYTTICEQNSLHIGYGIRIAARLMLQLSKSSTSCRSFWEASSDVKKRRVNKNAGSIIFSAAVEFNLSPTALSSYSDYAIHLQILISAADSCLSLLKRKVVANPEILDLLLVSSGYPANQGGVFECCRNTCALSDYQSIIDSLGPNALDSPTWRETYDSCFEWRIMTDRPKMMPCVSVAKLSRSTLSCQKKRWNSLFARLLIVLIPPAILSIIYFHVLANHIE